MNALDLFAGPGGWDEGVRRHLGLHDVHGVEWDATACATARAAGHQREQADVSTRPLTLSGYSGLIASPPCQGFSVSGLQLGRLDAHALIGAVRLYSNAHLFNEANVLARCDGHDTDPRSWALTQMQQHRALFEHMNDHRSLYVLEPLRHAVAAALAGHPFEWIAWEQVAGVLPLWDACAEVLRGYGYDAKAELVNAEQFGVPQIRKRAILRAVHGRRLAPLQPTHGRFDPRGDDAGRHLPPPVGMSSVLPWEDDDVVGFPRRYDGQGEPLHLQGVAYRARDLRRAVHPSLTVTEKVRSWSRWPATPPAPVAAAPSVADALFDMPAEPVNVPDDQEQGRVRITVQEASVLQSFPLDYPWKGSISQQCRQIGDAVPPLLAAHIVGSVIGEQP